MKHQDKVAFVFWVVYILCFAILLGMGLGYATAGPLDETRCCITPATNPDGSNKRRADVLRAFKKVHPCPSTGLTTGACPGWAMDHVMPLECGGIVAVSNLQWLPTPIKSAAGKWPKDRWERRIYCSPMEVVK